MYRKPLSARLAPLSIVLLASLLSACTQSIDAIATSSLGKKSYAYTAKDKECMARAMFFESRRSSREGMIAVGTVVMNRLESGNYPTNVCGVVGQKNQFAPGVLSRSMNSKALPDVQEAAEAVLKGERHPQVQDAMFFHQAGLNFPYPNMHYVLQAGGNAFYEKRGKAERSAKGIRRQSQLAAAGRKEGPRDRPQMVAVAKQPSAPAAEQVAAVPAPAPATVTTLTERSLPAAAMAYEVTPQAANAIGALLATQTRPAE